MRKPFSLHLFDLVVLLSTVEMRVILGIPISLSHVVFIRYVSTRYIIDYVLIAASRIVSSSPRAFPIIWGRRNGYAYHSSTLSCPVRPPPLTPHFLLHDSFHLVFCLRLRLFPAMVHLTFLERALRPIS